MFSFLFLEFQITMEYHFKWLKKKYFFVVICAQIIGNGYYRFRVVHKTESRLEVLNLNSKPY